MKLSTVALITLALAGSPIAFAQDTHTTTYQTAQGPLEVNWGQPAARQFGPPPSFAELASSGDGYISSAEAAAYPPLANDFIHADGNRDGRVSSAEYTRWSGKP
jgi:hypothetical protein